MDTQKSINQFKQSVLSVDDGVELLLRGKSVCNVTIDSEHEVTTYNKYASQVLCCESFLNKEDTSISVEESLCDAAQTWLFPEQYKNMDIESYIIDRCSDEGQKKRAIHELTLYKQKDLYVVLKFLVFLVDFMRENNIIWGVGRGSSVASLCLYIIGINRINPMDHNLDIEEFLK